MPKLNGPTPEPIKELFVRNQDAHGYETGQRSDPHLMELKYAVSRASFQCLGPSLWSRLSIPLRNVHMCSSLYETLQKGCSE